jgi:hypothetical protein
MKRMENKLDDLFQEGLEEHKMVPGRDIWAEIAAAQAKKKKKRFLILFLFLGVGTAMAGYYLLRTQDNSGNRITQQELIKSDIPAPSTGNGISNGTSIPAPQTAGKKETGTDMQLNSGSAGLATPGSAIDGDKVLKNQDEVDMKTGSKKGKPGAAGKTPAERITAQPGQAVKEKVAAGTKVKDMPVVNPGRELQAVKTDSEVPPADKKGEVAPPEVTFIQNIFVSSPQPRYNTIILKDKRRLYENDIPEKGKSPRDKFYVSIGVAPAYTELLLGPDTIMGSRRLDARKQAEQAKLAFQGSVNIGFNLTKHFDLSVGMGFANARIHSSATVLVPDSVFDRVRKTFYKSDPNVPLLKIRQDSLKKYQPYEKTFESMHRFTFMRFPVSVSYRFGKGRSTWMAGVGGAFSYLMKASGNIFTNDSLKGYEISYSDLQMRKWNTEATILAGYERRLGKKFSCLLQPSFSFSLHDMIDGSYTLRQRYYSLALWTGIKYSF